MAPGCASRKLSRSRPAISIPSACCCASSAGRGARTAMRCCRRSCSNCCAPGGARGGGAACCCREAGCFQGNPVEPLSARQLCRVVRAAAQAAGITKRVSPHTLRHSFATHLLEQDVDIRVIQTLLGHAKLDTTALYTRVANSTIRAVTSPLDRLAQLIDGRPRPGT